MYFSYRKFSLVALVVILSGCSSMAKDYKKGVIPVAKRASSADIVNTKSLLNKALKGKVKLSQSGSDYHLINTIVKRLSVAAGLGSWSYPVYIGDAGNEVNAMAVNDNTILVYKKLISNVGRDTGLLATILAHEVAHILGKHGHDSTNKNRSIGVILGSLALGVLVEKTTGSREFGSFSREIGNMVGIGTLVRPYDRSVELEADHVGMLLMAKAGYDPRIAIRFWANSTKYLGASSSSFLSTHPSHADRKKKLLETLPLALKIYRK